MIMTPLDPRIRMRDALHELVQENPTSWDRPSLFIVRNRLLDRTGSDARPLAELLIEALRRGWRDRLPAGAVDTARWQAMTSSFVMQWSTERFIQPEMARWAVESWGYAMRVIDANQLTIAPPPRREPIAAMAARLNSRAAQAGAQTARAVAQGTRVTSPRSGTPGAGTAAVAFPTRGTAGGSAMAGAAAGGRLAPRSRPTGSSVLPSPWQGAHGARSRQYAPPVPAWVTKAMAGTLVLMALVVVGRVALAARGGSSGRSAARIPAVITEANANPNANANANAGIDPSTLGDSTRLARQRDARTAQAISPAARALRTDVTLPEVATRLPAPVPPSSVLSPGPLFTGDARNGKMVSPSLTGGIAIVAAERPGVPSITRSVMPTVADSARMIFVQPARRAAGESRPVPSPTARVALTYDELRLVNGTVMRGRVDVVQSGSVIFRDQRSGLRYEIRKDEIEQIISELGVPVRFRAATAAPTGTRGTPATATPRAVIKTNGLRDRGVAGRYRIRYAAASAVGSHECTDVWNKPPNTEDVAIVRHIPGADTLNVAFEGGDNFPSNVDGDGFFASTFRIVPDQARTMTALTTRLNGQFETNGTLRFTVNIVFFRRMRSGGDVTCNVTINATGLRF